MKGWHTSEAHVRRLVEWAAGDLSRLTDTDQALVRAWLAQDPDRRAEWDSLRRDDLALGEAFCSVHVPEGFESRIRQALAQPPEAVPVGGTLAPSANRSAVKTRPAENSERGVSRRRWLGVVGATAAATAVGWAGWRLWHASRPRWSAERLMRQAIEWFDAVAGWPPQRWQVERFRSPTAGTVFEMLAVMPWRSARLATPLDARTRVWELPIEAPCRAFVFILRSDRVDGLAGSFQSSAGYRQRQVCVDACRIGTTVNILIDNGNPELHRRLLRQSMEMI